MVPPRPQSCAGRPPDSVIPNRALEGAAAELLFSGGPRRSRAACSTSRAGRGCRLPPGPARDVRSEEMDLLLSDKGPLAAQTCAAWWVGRDATRPRCIPSEGPAGQVLS